MNRQQSYRTKGGGELMSTQTNEQTYSTDLLTKAKSKFEYDLIKLGQKPEKGKPFELFYEKFNQAIAEGKPFQNPAQLQSAVGGRYLKAQIAFYALESQKSTLSHRSRDVPDWFITPLEQALKVDIQSLWHSVEQDIATVVDNRVKSAEHCSEIRLQQAIQSGELVEELQEQLKGLEGLPRQLANAKKENDRLTDEVKNLKDKLETLQTQSDASFSYQRENAVLIAENERLQTDSNLLRIELTQCNEITQQALIDKAKLEGRLAERQNINFTEPTSGRK